MSSKKKPPNEITKEDKVVSDQTIKANLLGDQIGKRQSNVRAVFMKADKKLPTEPGSKALDDPTGETADGTGVIDPSYDLLSLSQFREVNNGITSMIDSYKTNIAGFGHKFQYNIDMASKEIEENIQELAKKEWLVLENFYKYCNFDQSFEEILQRVIDDKEYMGFGLLEVLENQKGESAGFEYIPAHTVKLTKLDPEPQVVTLETVDETGKVLKILFQKKFRRFRQEVDNTVIWFKEFGDPRELNKETGEFAEKGLQPEERASGLIMFSNPVPYSVYGLPRWIGNFIGMQGSRKAEELNFRYFSHGRHTPLAILVKNGSLTQSSMDVLKDYVTNVEGVENAFGYLVLEGIGYEDETGDGGAKAVDIEVKPLIDAIQTDGLFQQYDKDNRDKLRESLRLAPIYTGASKDYTRATADVARAITEEQVFQPERKKISDKINRLVNQSLGIKYVDMILNGPDITNKKDLADTVSIYQRTGAITPNMIMQSVSNLLGQEFENINEPWADLPLNVVLELIKKDQIKLEDLIPKETEPTVTDGNA